MSYVERILDEETILFWISNTNALLQAASDVILLNAEGVISRRKLGDLEKHSEVGGRTYFKYRAPSAPHIDDIICGSSFFVVISEYDQLRLRVFQPLAQTLAISQVRPGSMGSTFKLLRPNERREVRRAVEYGTRPFPTPLLNKKLAAVITYANDASGWFPAFVEHYTAQLGTSTCIYVATPNAESFNSFRLGGVIGLDAPYDDASRAQLFTGLSFALAGYYRWTIVADTDELILPDPRGTASTIAERLHTDGEDTNVHFSLGLDVVEVDGDGEYDFRKPPLGQRRYGVLNSGMCKPHISRGTLHYDIGSHYCQFPTVLPAAGDGFVMLHMKYASATVRREVARIVESTSYSEERILNYSLSSVRDRDRHPAFSAERLTAAKPFSQFSTAEFQQSISEALRYDGDRDLYIGRNFVDDKIIDLLR